MATEISGNNLRGRHVSTPKVLFEVKRSNLQPSGNVELVDTVRKIPFLHLYDNC